jgi:hypothetical protein
MIHRPAPRQPRRARRGVSRTRQTLTALSGLAAFLTAAITLAPAASAILPPPEPSAAPVPPPPPPPTVPAHFPLWAAIAIVAATVVLSVATTLVTLALEHRHRAHHTPAAGPQPGASSPSTTAEAQAGPGEILTSHQHLADYDMYRADSR